MNKLITVFEHSRIFVGESGDEINLSEFESLCRYHSKISNKLFSVERKSVKFNHHVGVIQVGKLIIEVLPKGDRGQSIQNWQDGLLHILKYTGKLRVKLSSTSNVTLSNSKILEHYVFYFVEKVNELLREGLSKKYHSALASIPKVKGQISFSENIKKKLIDRSRIACKFQEYSVDHRLHRRISTALNLLSNQTYSDELNQKIHEARTWFPNLIDDYIATPIILDRRTCRYEEPLEMANLIIQSLSPNSKCGDKVVLAFMFDMNNLFEEMCFKIASRSLSRSGYQVRKSKSTFWKDKIIKPDILIESNNGSLIIDTKWKIPSENRPSDADLKQMYIYGQYFNSKDTFLLYPHSEKLIELEMYCNDGLYEPNLHHQEHNLQYCRVKLLNLFNPQTGKIDFDYAETSFLKFIANYL